MLMTQLDHGLTLSPSTPQYKLELDPKKSPQHPSYESLNTPLPWLSALQTEAKEEGERMLHKNTVFFPSVLLALLYSSVCFCHGQPTLLTSDVVASCCDNLANRLTSAPTVQNL